MTDRLLLACSDVDDLAALYVLDALGGSEAYEVAGHLTDHARRHPSFRELAGVTPFLAESVDPVAPPPDLRSRVLGAVAATPQARPVVRPAAPPAPAGSQMRPAAPLAPGAVPGPRAAPPAPAAVPGSQMRPAAPPAPAAVPGPRAAPPAPAAMPGPGATPASPTPASLVPYPTAPEWAAPPTPAAPPEPTPIAAARDRRARRSPIWTVLAAAAVVAIVALGGWNLLLQRQSADAEHRLALLTGAVAAAGRPGAILAPMSGTETAAGASGYAVFPAEGTGYIVLSGLPAAPRDHAWQAWTIVPEKAPASAGLMAVGSDGLAVLEGVQRIEGTKVVALTIEPAGGSTGPTTTPVVIGQLDAPLAISGGELLAFGR